MRFIGPSTLAVVLGLFLGLAGNGLAEEPSPNRPKADKNNLWYVVNDLADTAIVFVHGIGSDSRDAWYVDDAAQRGAGYWPALVRDDPNFAEAAIFLGGYHTAIDSHDYDFRDAANELYRSLKISIDPASEAVLDKPNILFVTHSAGGIVVRHMLTREAGDFAEKTVGLLLFASPSNGARDADRLSFISDWVRSKQGHQLTFDNPFLESLDKDFKKLLYERKIPKLVGSEWLEHRLVYSKYFGIARDSVLVEPESGGRYFSEPITIHETDHISIVKPNDRDHRTYREFRYFYETDFAPLLQSRSVTVRPAVSGPSVASPNGGPSIRIDEKHRASLCDDRVTVELTSVWKKHGGRPKGTVTLSSVAIDEGKTTMKVGQSLNFTGGCSATLIDTGRDSKYYAIFE